MLTPQSDSQFLYLPRKVNHYDRGNEGADLGGSCLIQGNIGEPLHLGNDGNEVLGGRKGSHHLAAEKIQNRVSVENPFQDHSFRIRA